MVQPNIFYKENKRWTPLPDWCEFYFTLGITLGKNIQEEKNSREIIAVVVPTRAYISMIITHGLIYSFSEGLSNNVVKQKYFKEFQKLDIGTPLIRLDDDNIKKGYFKGVEKIDYFDNSIRIKFQETNSKSGGKLIDFLKRDEIHKIQIGGHDLDKLPTEQRGREVYRRNNFLMYTINKQREDISLIPDYQCALIGNLNLFKFELRTSIATKNNKNEYIEGDFQDILRVERYLRQGEALRTKIFSDRQNDMDTESEIPSTVIFDGANSFIKFRNYWRRTNCIVILDQTDVSNKEAIEYIKEDFYQRRISNITMDILPLPGGVEFMNYQERIL